MQVDNNEAVAPIETDVPGEESFEDIQNATFESFLDEEGNEVEAPADPAPESKEEPTTEEEDDDEGDEPSEDPEDDEDPEGDEPPEVMTIADELDMEAKAILDAADPELRESSPAMAKRWDEITAGALKVVSKAKDVGAGFDLYRQMEAGLKNEETAPEVFNNLVTYLTSEEVGLDRAHLLSKLGVEQALPVLAVDDAAFEKLDWEDPVEREQIIKAVSASAVKAAKDQLRQEMEPSLSKSNEAYEAVVKERDELRAREAINEAIPDIRKALARDYNGIKFSPAEIREAHRAHPESFDKDPVATVAGHFVKKIHAHSTETAVKRSPTTDSIEKNQAPVGVVERDPNDMTFEDFAAGVQI